MDDLTVMKSPELPGRDPISPTKENTIADLDFQIFAREQLPVLSAL